MTAKPRARRSSPLYLPSALELFKPSRDIITNNFGIFGPLFIIPLIFWLHSWVWIPATGGHYWFRFSDASYSLSAFPAAYFDAFVGFSILWLIITVAFGTLVQIMLQRAQLDAVEHKKSTLSHLWAVAKQFAPKMFGLYAVLGILIGGGVLLGLTVSIVFYLLCIPGLIMLRRYIFAPYVMLERKCGIVDAMAGSATLSNLNRGAVWGVIGVLAIIGLIGLVPIVGSIASFTLGVLYSAAPAIRYQQLKKLA